MMEISGIKIDVGYTGRTVLKDFDITVRQGEITTFVGPNGSGKSTLLKTLTRLIACRRGVVRCGGVPLDKVPGREFARHVGVLPQQHIAPPGFLVRDLVGFGRVPYQSWHSGLSREDEEAVEKAMKATGVWQLRDKTLTDCSGGEAQRVWIATVLAQEPDILFLDEPTTFLDISYQLEILRLVKKLNRELGMGVVMVLHDLAQAMAVSDRIVVIKDGRKYGEGPPESVITPQMMRDVYHVGCRMVHVEGRERPVLVYDEIS